MLTDLDHLKRDPMILDPSDLGKADVNARAFTVQPKPHFHKVAGNQQVGRSDLTAGFTDLQHTPVGFKPLMHASQHTIDRQGWRGPAGLLLSYSHTVG